MEYPLNIKIEYTNTSEYRECLRNLFKMNKNSFQEKINNIENHNKEKLDDITKDEISYDNDAAILMMEYTFNKKKNINEFKKLYKMAALRMFSEDLTIGQAVLFSYDYLYYYHYCLVEIFNNRFHKDFELYKKLFKLLS